MDIFARQQAKPFFLVLIRLVVMAALAAATYGILRVTGISRDFPPTDTIYFPFVTIICGVVIWRTFRQYNVSFWAYLGFERHRIGKDIAWGLLWLVVTYIPLIITLMGAMYLMFGADMFNHFEQIFSKSSPQLPGGAIATISILSAIIFLANAPIEEIIYRGWLQTGLTHRYGAVVAILVQGCLGCSTPCLLSTCGAWWSTDSRSLPGVLPPASLCISKGVWRPWSLHTGLST